VEGGHESATVVLHADPHAVTPSEKALEAIDITASASIDGRLVVRPVDGLKKLTIGEAPKARVTLAGSGSAGAIEIRPGQSVTALLSIERNDFDGELNFDIENLPHGVIV